MKKLVIIIPSFFILVVFFLILVHQVSAQGFNVNIMQPEGYGIKALGVGQGRAEGVVETILRNVISIFFTIGGIGVVVYFIWGAVDWILSGGDKEKVANARKKITHAIIGLVLLSLSYVIINIIGSVIGFNPLGYLQLRGLGDSSQPTVNQ